MVLPLYLAMTESEMWSCAALPDHYAYMACHFSPYGQALANLPDHLPEGTMLILNDRLSCKGHCPELVVQQLREAVEKHGCDSVLLDFQQAPEPEGLAMVQAIAGALPCPVAVSEGFANQLSCPVFLAPGPLHIPLEKQLAPWKGREIWLEAALCQGEILITEKGVEYTPVFPTEALSGGFYEEELRCCYHTDASSERIRFTLFDTRESLEKKLEYAHSLGIQRAVGLWQGLRSGQ